MLADNFQQVLLVEWHPDVNPSRVQLGWSWRGEEFGVGLCIEVKCAEGVIFAKVNAKIAAPWVSGLPVKHVEIAFDIEIAKAVLDSFVADVLVVCWKIFGGRGWLKRTCHGLCGVDDEAGASPGLSGSP
jgi:hypothetical protein